MAKMYDRILLLIFSAVTAFLAVVTVGVTFGWVGYDRLSGYVHTVYSEPLPRGAFAAMAVLLLLLSLRFVYLSMRRDDGRFPSVERRTDYGEVRISYETLQNLALKAAGRIKGLGDIRARIRLLEKGLEIELSTLADGEMSITAICEETQRSVKTHIEEMTGLPVAGVSVYVRNVGAAGAPAFKSRVE